MVTFLDMILGKFKLRKKNVHSRPQSLLPHFTRENLARKKW